MLRRNLVYLLFLFFNFSFCIAQNPDAVMSFKVKDKCEAIIFITGQNDSILYDTDKKYQLKIKDCSDSCYFLYNDYISYSWIPNPGSFSYQRDSTKLDLAFGWAGNIQIEIVRTADNKIMNAEFKNIADLDFYASITFKEGNYLINVREAYKKEGYPIKVGPRF